MFHNIDALVTSVVMTIVLLVFLLSAKKHVRAMLADIRIAQEMDKMVDDPHNIEALARSIGMIDTNQYN